MVLSKNIEIVKQYRLTREKMAKYFVITKVEEVRQVKIWNMLRTKDQPLLCLVNSGAEWMMWEVDKFDDISPHEMLPLFLKHWVKSIQMVSEFSKLNPI